MSTIPASSRQPIQRPAVPARAAPVPPIEVLDTMAPEDFVAGVAPLFEGAPSFLGRLAAARPFG